MKRDRDLELMLLDHIDELQDRSTQDVETIHNLKVKNQKLEQLFCLSIVASGGTISIPTHLVQGMGSLRLKQREDEVKDAIVFEVERKE